MHNIKVLCVIFLLALGCINTIFYNTAIEKMNSLVIIISLTIFIIIISIIPVSFIYKIALISIPIYLYNNNIRFIARLLKIFYKWTIKYPSKDRKDDIGLGNDILQTYKQHFNVIENFKDIPSRPTIFVANYCTDRIENVLCITLPVKQSVVMRDLFKNPVTVFGNIITSPIYIKHKGSYDYLCKEVKTHHEQGRYIFAYITKGKYNSYSSNTTGKVTTGILNIAKLLNISVTPICIDSIDYDNIGRLKHQNFEIHIGKEINIRDIDSDVLTIKKFFKQTLNRFEKQKYM